MRSFVRWVPLLLCACGPLVPAGSSFGDAGSSSGDVASSSGDVGTGGSTSGPSGESSTGGALEGPSVGLSAVVVEPPENLGAVRVFVDEHREALLGCYVAALADDPAIGGRFTIRADVEATGKPGAVSVSAAGLPSSLRECWVAEVSGWTFTLEVPVFTTVAIPGVLVFE